MNDVPDLSTLPQRMRYAADVLDEAGERGEQSKLVTPYAMWEAADLRNYASLFEAEDRGAVEREAALVEELAQELYGAASHPIFGPLSHASELIAYHYRQMARHLIESGWRKGDPA